MGWARADDNEAELDARIHPVISLAPVWLLLIGIDASVTHSALLCLCSVVELKPLSGEPTTEPVFVSGRHGANPPHGAGDNIFYLTRLKLR